MMKWFIGLVAGWMSMSVLASDWSGLDLAWLKYGADTATQFVYVDQPNRTVYIYAHTGTAKPSDPLEFVVVGPESGHGYESLAVSEAYALAIDDALRSIGLMSGWPVNEKALAFWPHGDRIQIHLHYMYEGELQHLPAERAIWDQQEGQPLAASGWAFTEPGDTVKPLADTAAPFAIASIFNHPETLMDYPRRGNQQQMYTRQVLSSKVSVPTNVPAMVTFRPLPNEFRPMVLDVQVTSGSFEARQGGTGVWQGQDLQAFSRWLVKRNLPPVLYLHFDSQMPLQQMRNIAQQLLKLVDSGEITLAPPPQGGIFLSSLLPPASFKDRKTRPLQPMELHLRGYGSRVVGSLYYLGDDENVEFPVPSEKSLGYLLSRHQKRFPEVMFIYARPDWKLESIQPFLNALPYGAPVYIFLEAPPPVTTAKASRDFWANKDLQ